MAPRGVPLKQHRSLIVGTSCRIWADAVEEFLIRAHIRLPEQGVALEGEELDLARNTVRKYVRQAPEPPLPTPRPLRASQLDPYEDYLLERWSKARAQRCPTVSRNQCMWLSGLCYHGTSVCRSPAQHHRRWLCASLT